MCCLWGVLGWFWIFVKNFFEGHTSPPPRSAFAPPVPLCSEPGYFDRFTNLLCVNLLQHWYTCFCVATSAKNSVFGGYFWRGCFVYILRKWIFYFAPFPILFCFILSYLFYRWFVLFVLLYFVPIVSRGGVVSLLARWLMCHVTTLPHYHVIELPRWLWLPVWKLTTLWSYFAVEVVAVVGASIGDTGSLSLTLLS